MNAATTSALLKRYRRAVGALRALRILEFASDTKVWVKCAQYTGPGVVVCNLDCPPDKLEVKLPNGNAWWYPLEACKPVKKKAGKLEGGK